MILKIKHIIPLLFGLLATWVIFAAMPFFRMNGMYPQVDTQIIFLHIICGLMFFYISGKIISNNYSLKELNHPLIIIPFLLAVIGILSSLLANNFHASLSGSPQIGQGVFWYFDLAIILVVVSQIAHIRLIRIIFLINLVIVTFLVSFFTFFPHWQGLPISFYYFSDYLCFYGVLNFILFTTITRRFYLNFLAFILLGFYLSILDNRAAMLFWGTSFLIGLVYQIFKTINISNKIKNFLFSDQIFVFAIFLLSLLILLSSLYYWSSDYNLPKNIKDTLLDAPIVRGKIIENSLYGLDNIKSIILGNGWGTVPSLLLDNMNSWQYDELRLGYNLHFHTHNELSEHIVSLGLLGGISFLFFLYFIFKASNIFSFESKLGWFLFFKITCFWFLWTGTFSLFAIVLGCFIIVKNRETKYLSFLNHNTKFKNIAFSLTFTVIGLFLFYGSYITFVTAKTNSLLQYSNIVKENDNYNLQNKECIPFYNEFNRGGIVLDRFLQQYSTYLFSLDIKDIHEKDLNVLYQLQCKANEIILSGDANSSLLNNSVQVDTNFYYKFGNSELGKSYMKDNYQKWLQKVLIMTQTMSNRGDLIMPFLSYAINNNKNKDASYICKQSVRGLEAMCDLIKANQILAIKNISNEDVKKSITLIRKAVKKGLFNELIYGFWLNKNDTEFFEGWGLKGIPLSPDILFLISNEEKQALEEVIQITD